MCDKWSFRNSYDVFMNYLSFNTNCPMETPNSLSKHAFDYVHRSCDIAYHTKSIGCSGCFLTAALLLSRQREGLSTRLAGSKCFHHLEYLECVFDRVNLPRKS